MTLGSWVGLATAVGLLAYLVYTLVRPTRF
jgi:K+-transporting ATPase KdpF subunit